jgi:malto-oligosyltrehalose trehalohydrolase
MNALTLVLGNEELAMQPNGDGWFNLEAPAQAGDAYGFKLPSGLVVPDPAARAQMSTVHGLSKLVDPSAFKWRSKWTGRPWSEVVLYEAHVGTFTPEGTFAAMAEKLDHLVDAGFTALELCPVAQFAGNRGWGYDGVLMYAPQPDYGTPDDLKRLVDQAHAKGLMMFLDVVYNHFGPDGNYLGTYAPEFFNPERETPWGAAIAYDRSAVRQYAIENALFWLDEYKFDGLRLDATDQISDPSDEHLLFALARAVREHKFDHHRHLMTEDARNITSLQERRPDQPTEDGRVPFYDGEWNDDFHHVAHVLATGEAEGYYQDYAPNPRDQLLIALTCGYVQQGEPSPFNDGKPRGEPSAHLPPLAFVNFLQNHDQTGNRALGERLTSLAQKEAVETLTALLALSPFVPLFFQGEEWAETNPFRFFTDFEGDLADAVREGRRREFGAWAEFSNPEAREKIPDPNLIDTFEASKLDWSKREQDEGKERLRLFKDLMALRAEHIAPRLTGMTDMSASAKSFGDYGVEACWTLDDGTVLEICGSFGGAEDASQPRGNVIYSAGAFGTDAWAIRISLIKQESAS